MFELENRLAPINVSIKWLLKLDQRQQPSASVFVWSKGLVCPSCLNNHTWYSSMVSLSGPGWKLEKSAAATVTAVLLYFRDRSCCLPPGRLRRQLTVWLAHAHKRHDGPGLRSPGPGEARSGAGTADRARAQPSVIPYRVVLPRNLRQLFVFQPAILIRFPRQW